MNHNENQTINVKTVIADPSALGLLGLALVTLVASGYKFGVITGVALVVPWAIFLGALPQLVASMIDFKHNNVFGGTAFGGYGFFWLGMAMSWMIQQGVFGEKLMSAVDPLAFGYAYLGYLIFSVIMTIGAAETNKMLLLCFILIDLLFVGLTLSTFGIMTHSMHLLAAWSELAISIVAFYGLAGNVLNRHFGYKFVNLGKPLEVFSK